MGAMAKIALLGVLVIVMILVIGTIWMWCWNYVVPHVFGLPKIGWLQAICLIILCETLGSHHCGGRGKS